MLQMGLALADRARSAHACVAGRLGKSPFNPASRLIQVVEFRCRLTRPSRLEHLVAFWRKADRHAPPRRLRLRAAGAERAGLAGLAGLAGGLSKPDPHDRLAFGILAVMPGTIQALLCSPCGHVTTWCAHTSRPGAPGRWGTGRHRRRQRYAPASWGPHAPAQPVHSGGGRAAPGCVWR